jgi:hypothetical protein
VNTAFSHALCVLICPSCTAAVTVSSAGGQARCGVCDEELVVRPRSRAVSLPPDGVALPPSPGEPPELELPPLDGSLLALTVGAAGESLDPALALEAMRRWQDMRALEPAERSRSSEAAFLALTLLLDRHMSGQKDDLQRRALLETATVCTASLAYRQVLLAELSFCAARAGDLAAADDWLADCEPRAGGVQADSARRFAAAFIATLRRQHARVLELTGSRQADVAARLALHIGLLRAQAHAALGHGGEVDIELDALLASADAGEVERLAGELGAGKALEALPRARARRHARRPTRGRRLTAELPWMVVGAVFYAFALVTDASTTTARGQRLDVLFLAMAVSAMVPLGFMALRRRRLRRVAGRGRPPAGPGRRA